MTIRRFVTLSLLLTLGAVGRVVEAQRGLTQPYDVLITGGRVYDGTGNPWFYADVALSDGKIAAVGRLEGAKATTHIDGRGKVVVPGFIDLHSHADDELPQGGFRDPDPKRRAAANLVMQG